MLSPALAGLATGLGLIVAIGAQNAYVLRQGIRREHVGVVVALCALADVLLIGAGVAGVGALVTASPLLLAVLTWAGAAYLIWFAIGSFRSALHPQGLQADEAPAPRSGVALTTLALTFLNPHVYLDTVLMLGTIASGHGPVGRWWFAGGAMAASILWFSLLGLGARALAPHLARPSVWRVVDVLIGIMMLVIAALLVLR